MHANRRLKSLKNAFHFSVGKYKIIHYIKPRILRITKGCHKFNKHKISKGPAKGNN